MVSSRELCTLGRTRPVPARAHRRRPGRRRRHRSASAGRSPGPPAPWPPRRSPPDGDVTAVEPAPVGRLLVHLDGPAIGGEGVSVAAGAVVSVGDVSVIRSIGSLMGWSRVGTAGGSGRIDEHPVGPANAGESIRGPTPRDGGAAWIGRPAAPAALPAQAVDPNRPRPELKHADQLEDQGPEAVDREQEQGHEETVARTTVVARIRSSLVVHETLFISASVAIRKSANGGNGSPKISHPATRREGAGPRTARRRVLSTTS